MHFSHILTTSYRHLESNPFQGDSNYGILPSWQRNWESSKISCNLYQNPLFSSRQWNHLASVGFSIFSWFSFIWNIILVGLKRIYLHVFEICLTKVDQKSCMFTDSELMPLTKDIQLSSKNVTVEYFPDVLPCNNAFLLSDRYPLVSTSNCVVSGSFSDSASSWYRGEADTWGSVIVNDIIHRTRTRRGRDIVTSEAGPV